MIIEGHRKVLSWSDDNTLKLWDLERGELRHTLSGHASWVLGASLLDQGRRGLSWSNDSTLKLWDLERGELLHTLSGHHGSVHDASLLARHTAISRSEDRTLRLWNLQTGEMLATYYADVTITTMAFSEPLGRIFAGDALGHTHLIQLNWPPSAERRQT